LLSIINYCGLNVTLLVIAILKLDVRFELIKLNHTKVTSLMKKLTHLLSLQRRKKKVKKVRPA